MGIRAVSQDSTGRGYVQISSVFQIHRSREPFYFPTFSINKPLRKDRISADGHSGHLSAWPLSCYCLFLNIVPSRHFSLTKVGYGTEEKKQNHDDFPYNATAN